MTRPPPIRLIVAVCDPDRDGARARQLFESLRRDWFEPAFWLVRKTAMPPSVLPSGGGIAQFAATHRGFPTRMRLARQLRQVGPALVCTVGAPPDPWTRGVCALLRIPLVAAYTGPVVGRHARLLNRFAARILVDSAALKNDLTRQCAVEPDRITVAADTQQIEQALLEVAQRGTGWTTTSDGEIPLELPLGPDPDGPSPNDTIEERGRFRPDRSVRRTARATITAFLPAPDCATGAAMIICPGGGYGGVTIDKEGFDVARRLNTVGIAGIVLKYRLPRPDLTRDGTPMPMEDLAHALALVRQRAPAWNIDRDRIGVMGFSAGGHMAAAATQVAAPPAFAVLVYPVISMQPALTHAVSRRNLLGRSPPPALVERYSLERHATAGIPPCFLVHARDDDVVDVNNSIRYGEALRQAGVPHESLIYEQGGHGFGLAKEGEPTATWFPQCMAWLRARHLLERRTAALPSYDLMVGPAGLEPATKRL